MSYAVVMVTPSGVNVETEIDTFDSVLDADVYCDWLNDTRNAAQMIDGTIFEVRNTSHTHKEQHVA